jgi:hypothetical protein
MMPFTRYEHDVIAGVGPDVRVVVRNPSLGTLRHAPAITLIGTDADHYV